MEDHPPATNRLPTALASLRRYLEPRAVRERCELCGLELPDEHDHLLELTSRQIACACQACAILFSQQGAKKYRRAPRRIRLLPDFQMSELQWQALDLPINLAFFVFSSAAARVVAYYPSPAGATEALPSAEAWQTVVDENPTLRDLEPDVEALLVNRLTSPPEYYRAGIDRCYKLVGLIRTQWHGISGGDRVWQQVQQFFNQLKEHAG